MTASLSSLPVELLREIVRLVEEQDLEAWKRGVEIAEPPPLYRDDAPVWPVDVVAGRFSSFYERGVQALSLVNKQLRQVALPHLYEASCALSAALRWRADAALTFVRST